jgi:hypothetical protein
MEPYAHAVAELDACRITRGGLFLDKAHTDALRSFARAYRALPRQKFATVGASTDPAALRTILHDSRRYFYAVNREYYPVDTELAFSRDPKTVRDLATGDVVSAARKWRLTLGPYELRSFTIEAGIEITGFTVAVPAEITGALIDEGERALRTFASVRAAGKCIPGMDEMEVRLRSALADKRVAWLRRALSGYIVRQCKSLVDGPARE